MQVYNLLKWCSLPQNNGHTTATGSYHCALRTCFTFLCIRLTKHVDICKQIYVFVLKRKCFFVFVEKILGGGENEQFAK